MTQMRSAFFHRIAIYCLDMQEVVAAVLLVCGIAWGASAMVLIGAVLSLGRSDHQNPVAYRWIAWHARHSVRSIHL